MPLPSLHLVKDSFGNQVLQDAHGNQYVTDQKTLKPFLVGGVWESLQLASAEDRIKAGMKTPTHKDTGVLAPGAAALGAATLTLGLPTFITGAAAEANAAAASAEGGAAGAGGAAAAEGGAAGGAASKAGSIVKGAAAGVAAVTAADKFAVFTSLTFWKGLGLILAGAAVLVFAALEFRRMAGV